MILPKLTTLLSTPSGVWASMNPDISEDEYLRDAFYKEVPGFAADVQKEQNKIQNADVIAFVYPVFWTEAPAKMVGWFDRVWRYGFAYGNRKMKKMKKAIFLCTCGHSLENLKQMVIMMQ